MSGVEKIFHIQRKLKATCFPALILLLAIGCVHVDRQPGSNRLERFEFEEPQMGVPFRIVLYAPDETTANSAVDAAFARIAQLNQVMSDYETDSELSQLSQSSGSGKAVKLSEDLWRVLQFSQRIAQESRGAFDVTIGPCVGLWRKARREKELPEPDRIEHFRSRVGYQNLVLDNQAKTATLLKPNMRLDLGGIAKGYAADEALKILRQHGISRAIIAASGDLALGDPPPGETGWSIELAGSDLAGSPPTQFVKLSNVGVATSGDLFQRLEINGVRYSHILNPFTCLGMTNHALVSVVAPNGMSADALATTLTILDPKKGLSLAQRYNAAARVIRLEGDHPETYLNAKFRKIQKK